MSLLFSWDPAKAASNFKKHGVSFQDASTVFGDILSRTIADPDHSLREQRYITIGITETGRLLVVAHADHGDAIRLISARPATRTERKRHEEG